MTRSIPAAILAILVFVPAARAADGIAVSYGDLDLSTRSGQAALTGRLQAAAGTLCRPVLDRVPDSEPSIHEHQVLYRACVGRLAERAMAKVRLARD